MLNKDKYESIYEFGPFRLETGIRRLTRDGHVIPLTARLLDLLLLLAIRRGEVVTKEEILLEVWHGEAVEENNVAVAVSTLRRALSDNPGEREYIETVPKRGYRFVAKVHEAGIVIQEQSELAQSIAVLPFTNEGGDESLEYLSDGITTSVISILAHLPLLRVVAFNTSSKYKGRIDNILEVGREIGANTVLVGRVGNSGGKLFVGVELVNVKDGTRIWGEQYDRVPSDILLLQAEIAQEISENLRLRLTANESKGFAKNHTSSVEAYHFYLKGKYFSKGCTAEEVRKGIKCFEQAIEIDPRYALAYAGLADARHLLVAWHAQPPAVIYPMARQSALKALEIDDSLSEAHASLAFIEFHTRNWQVAEQGFKRSIALNPNNDLAFRRYSMYLSAMGRLREAIEVCEKGLILDPLSSHMRTQLARHYYYARDYDRALEECGEALDLNKDWPDAHAVTGLIYLKKGMYKEALEAFRRTANLLPDDPEPRMLLGCAYAALGRRKDAQDILSYLRKLSLRSYVPPHLVAWVYVHLRDADNAFQWLEKAYEHQSYALAYLKIAPLFDPIRSDPRFAVLLRRCGLA